MLPILAANRVEPPCLGGLSDHVPIFVKISDGLQKRRAAHKRVIPRYVLESPVSVETFDELLNSCGVELDRMDPFAALRLLRKKGTTRPGSRRGSWPRMGCLLGRAVLPRSTPPPRPC